MTRVFTQTFGVAGAFLERDGKILLVRENQGPDSGKWNHPAGWIEVGENPLETVKREAKEETGFDFEPTHLLGAYSLVRKDLEKSMRTAPHPIKLIFIGSISDTLASNLQDDVSETKWFTPAEIEAMDSSQLRDSDIKQMAKDYFAGKRFPLEALTHTVSH